jgi:hypothetical protein
MLSETRIVETPDARGTRSLEIILGLLPLILGLQLLIWIVYLPVALRGSADFRAYYSAGYLVRSGQAGQLYDLDVQKGAQNNLISPSSTLLPFIHPPYESLLFVPFAWFRYRTAYWLFLGLNLVCVFDCYRLLRGRLWRLHAMWRYFPLLLIVGFTPVVAALMQGQDSLIFFLLLAAALANLEGGRELVAGALVGLALFRFQIVLPIAVFFLIWRRWRFLGGFCVSAVPALALSGVVAGIAGLKLYMALLLDLSVKLTAAGQARYGVPITRMPNLRGLLFSVLHLQSRQMVALTLILSFLIVLVGAWAGRKATPVWQLTIAISASVVVGYHVLTHDLSILLIPMAMLLDQQIPRGLWNVSLVWLSTPLCFFAYDYVASLPVLGLFVFLMWRLWRTSGDQAKVGTVRPAIPVKSVLSGAP